VIEPALDLAIAVAVASNLRDLQVDPSTVVLGEIGLAGEVRGVSQIEKRVREAARLGFERAIVPAHSVSKVAKSKDIKLVGVETVYRGVEAAIGDFRRSKASMSKSKSGE
jgi:DNA repair protein RadA/Sms